ncbi:MAG TPA: hypothetical protein V6D48_16870 [Oculatellaceae cyanobacterium]
MICKLWCPLVVDGRWSAIRGQGSVVSGQGSVDFDGLRLPVIEVRTYAASTEFQVIQPL